MTLTALSAALPGTPPLTLALAFTSSVIDATGEKVAWTGPVWNAARATKSVRKVHFLFGTVTKAGGSGLTVSLQDVSTAAGPPTQPDETQDQTVAIANADAGFVTDAWYTTGNLSADRSVAFGEMLAVVVEYDGSGRLGADVVNFRNLTNVVTNGRFSRGGFALKTASWALVDVINNVILEFSDGTFGTLGSPIIGSTWPASAIGSTTFNSGSAADELALEFTVPVECKCDGAWFVLQANVGTDFDVVLYEGTTAKATVSCDANQINSTAVYRPFFVAWPEVTLSTGQTYRLAIKPGAGNVIIQYFDVAAAGHFNAHMGGTSWAYTDRVDGGAWAAPTTTRRPFMGITLSALHDGAGGSGGMLMGNLRGFMQ